MQLRDGSRQRTHASQGSIAGSSGEHCQTDSSANVGTANSRCGNPETGHGHSMEFTPGQDCIGTSCNPRGNVTWSTEHRPAVHPSAGHAIHTFKKSSW